MWYAQRTEKELQRLNCRHVEGAEPGALSPAPDRGGDKAVVSLREHLNGKFCQLVCGTVVLTERAVRLDEPEAPLVPGDLRVSHRTSEPGLVKGGL
jgi:hypothetical protein